MKILEESSRQRNRAVLNGKMPSHKLQIVKQTFQHALYFKKVT